MLGVLGRSEETVRSQISEALILLCSQVFHYDVEVTVEALVGVKIDKKEVYLFNVQNTTNKDEERRFTSGILQNDEEDDIEAIMIDQDSEEDGDEDADGNDSHYISNDEDEEDQDGDHEDGANDGNIDEEDDGNQSNEHEDSYDKDEQQNENEGESNEKEGANESEGELIERESEEAKNEGESIHSNEKEVDSNDRESNNKDRNGSDAQLKKGDDVTTDKISDQLKNESHENGGNEEEGVEKTGDDAKNLDKDGRKDIIAKDGQSDGAQKDSNGNDAMIDSKSNAIPVKRVPRQIVIPPLSKMVTRSKRKRLDSESEDAQPAKKSHIGVESYARKFTVMTKRSRSSSKDGGMNLHIKDSYTIKRGSLHDSQEERDDDLVFIKEEITDPAYEKSITKATNVTAYTKTIVPKVTSPRPIAPASTFVLQHVPGNNMVVTGNQDLQSGISGPILMPTTSQQNANRPLVFFTKNHRGELVQVKPPPNMKIILPTSSTSTGARTLTVTKNASPSQQVISGLANNPGLSVLQSLERNANMSPIMKTTVQEPQIRVIQVTPEAARVPNRFSPNYEREVDHPTMINKDGTRIKRPMNAFMIWAKEARSKILNESGGTLQNADVSKILGHRWKNMTREEQQPYYDEQRRLDLVHKAHYPDYRYQPRRKKPVPPKAYDATNIISLSPGSVVDHDSLYMHGSHSNSSFTFGSQTLDRILTSGSPSLGTISLCPEETAEDLFGGSSLIATPVSASDIIPDLPNLASALAASAAIEDAS